MDHDKYTIMRLSGIITELSEALLAEQEKNATLQNQLDNSMWELRKYQTDGFAEGEHPNGSERMQGMPLTVAEEGGRT